MTRLIFTLTTAAALAAQLAGPAAAQQSCDRNGQSHADGTRIGDVKCENGRWVAVQ